MGSITFRFSGVCTHFRGGIVPGVPHRVVLCDLTKFQVGSLQVTSDGPRDPVLYYTTPHFAQLDIKAQGASVCDQGLPDIDNAPGLPPLTIPNVVTPNPNPNGVFQGDIYSGVRLQVINGTDAEMTGDFSGVASLRDFFPDYAPSSEVVLKGRASFYLDLFGGCSWVTQESPDLPPVVWIRVATDGVPKLLFTPLAPSASWAPQLKTLPEDTAPGDDFTMFVANLEDQSSWGQAAAFDQGAYDYLLHYTTAQGGIPKVLSNRPPGLSDNLFPVLPPATLSDIGNSFQVMGQALLNTDPTARRTLVLPSSVTPACADSQFP